MSIFSALFPKTIGVRANLWDGEQAICANERVAYHYKTPIQQILSEQRQDYRIILAAELAESRCSGRHLGEDVYIEYTPWQSNGYYYPADEALSWLKAHGHKYGIHLIEK